MDYYKKHTNSIEIYSSLVVASLLAITSKVKPFLHSSSIILVLAKAAPGGKTPPLKLKLKITFHMVHKTSVQLTLMASYCVLLEWLWPTIAMQRMLHHILGSFPLLLSSFFLSEALCTYPLVHSTIPLLSSHHHGMLLKIVCCALFLRSVLREKTFQTKIFSETTIQI